MRASALATISCGVVLVLAGCGNDTFDPTVIFDHQPVMAQPWTAGGELVDAGLLCPNGDRRATELMHSDGTPWTMEGVIEAIDAAEASGGSHWDVPRMGSEEYVCYDGSGTFTLLEEVRAESPGRFFGEVTGGTGAYVNVTGSCVIEVTENEDHTEVLEMVGTCEFDMGTAG